MQGFKRSMHGASIGDVSSITTQLRVLMLQVGRVFTPVDAVALAAKAVLQTDLRRTARKVVEWLDSNS